MEFNALFAATAQNAILKKLEDGTWEDYPWLVEHVKNCIDSSLSPLTLEGGLPPAIGTVNTVKKSQFVDYHGNEVPADADTDNCQVRAVDAAEPEHTHDIIWQTDKAPVPKWRGESTSTPSGEFFRSAEFGWFDGYPFKILVASRDKDHTKGYAVHYRERPTQEEYARHFKLFHDGTHYVNIMTTDGENSTNINHEYKRFADEKPEESFDTTDEWPEGKQWRIIFHDQRIGRKNYVYCDEKPSGFLISKYHSAKGFAVTQRRPEGV